jgi:hypothetical protein
MAWSGYSTNSGFHAVSRTLDSESANRVQSAYVPKPYTPKPLYATSTPRRCGHLSRSRRVPRPESSLAPSPTGKETFVYCSSRSATLPSPPLYHAPQNSRLVTHHQYPARASRARALSPRLTRRLTGSPSRFRRVDLFGRFAAGKHVEVGETGDGLKALRCVSGVAAGGCSGGCRTGYCAGRAPEGVKTENREQRTGRRDEGESE